MDPFEEPSPTRSEFGFDEFAWRGHAGGPRRQGFAKRRFGPRLLGHGQGEQIPLGGRVKADGDMHGRAPRRDRLVDKTARRVEEIAGGERAGEQKRTHVLGPLGVLR